MCRSCVDFFLQKLLLPGDNDVGGEGADLRSVDKVLRFEKHFSRTYQLVSKKFVDFFAVSCFLSAGEGREDPIKIICIYLSNYGNIRHLIKCFSLCLSVRNFENELLIKFLF